MQTHLSIHSNTNQITLKYIYRFYQAKPNESRTRWQNETNLSECCVGLLTSATVEVFLTLGEDSGISCGLF